LRFHLVAGLPLFAILLSPCLIRAQILTSTVSGTVSSEEGHPLPGTVVQWVEQGRTISVLTDEKGSFSLPFVNPGLQVFRFEHPSIADWGDFEIRVDPQHELNLQVVMYETHGNASGSGYWEILRQSRSSLNAAQIERVYTSEWMESIPSARHLWSLLNHTAATIVTDRFDISGMHSDRQLLLSSRGSSWTQNQAIFNGISVTHPAGEGMLIFPDLSALESVTYAVGYSPTTHTGTGAHLIMLPKSGKEQMHGQAHLFFQGGALQDTNPNSRHRFFGISESDERWKHYFDGNFQIGGPIGNRPWTYFGSYSQRNLGKNIRTYTLPVYSAGSAGTVHVVGQLSPKDQLGIHWTGQRYGRPQAGASPQIRREATLDETDSFHVIQGSWSRFFSPKSLIDLRFGAALARTDSGYQADARGQSREHLFQGYADYGSMHPNDMVALLNNGRSGRAPFIGSDRNQHWQISGSLSTVRRGFLDSNHRISAGGGFRILSSSHRKFSLDGINLRYFQGVPDSVRLLNTPNRTLDRIRQWEIYGSDSISLGRLSLDFGASATFTTGKNLLRSGQGSNSIGWQNLSGRLGIAYRMFNTNPLVIRGSMARIHHQPLISTWTAVNPEGPGSRIYTWGDTNQDGQYQEGENRQILKVSGSPYTEMDPSLKNPHISEINLGFEYGLGQVLFFHVNGFRRVDRDLMSLVNVGVPFSAYTPVHVLDPGDDGHLGAGGDDAYVTVYNQSPETLGQDRYLLTNPKNHNSFAEGFDVRMTCSLGKFRAEAAVTRCRAVTATAPGQDARQNDPGILAGIFDDPNKAIFANGSTFFDRGTLAHLWISYELPWKSRMFVINSYQDGLPYSRYLPVTGLNQGTIGILTRQRGPGAPGSEIGFRTTYNLTVDMRLSRVFALGPGRITGIVDVFNVFNFAQSLVQTDVTAPTHLWRIPLSFQTPRSFQLGLRYQW